MNYPSFRFQSVLLVAFCGVAAPRTAQAQAQVSDVLQMDSAVTTGVFENGLRYYIRANERPENRAELRLVVNVGSVLENDDQLGIAHLLEHMAFNGTEHFEKQELVNYLESIGMRFGPNVNAFTSFDETVYMLTVPTDSAGFLAQGFQILEDWAHGITLAGDDIDAERGVVVEEWRLGRGAGARIRDRQFPVLFTNSRYAERLPIGNVEVLQTFEHETIRDFYRQWYRPDLMAVVAVGDFDPDSIETLIRSHFESIPVPAEPLERPYFDVPGHAETLIATATDPEATSSQVSVYYKQPVRSGNTAWDYRQGLVEQLFNSMFNNRLQELAQAAEPPFLMAFSGQGQLVRTSEVYQLTAMVSGGGLAAGLEAVLLEAERIRRHGFTDTELERQKGALLRNMERVHAERDKRDSGVFAAEYRRHFLTGEPAPGIEAEWAMFQRFVPTISLEEVNSLAATWLVDRDRVVLASSPEGAGIAVPSDEEFLAVFDAVAASDVEPYQDSAGDIPLLAEVPMGSPVVSEASFAELGVTIWELGNGVRVLVKPTDFQDDQIVFRSFSPGGISLVADEDYVAAMTASAVVSQAGVGEFNLIDLQKELAGKAVSVAPSIGTYTEGLNGGAAVADLETMFQLIYLYFTVPRPDTTAFLSYRSRLVGFLENRNASPLAAYSDTIQAILTQGHYRARPFSVELLDEMDLGTSLAIYRDRFADASDFTFVFAGNIDLEQLRPLVETYLGGLPSIGRQEVGRSQGIEPPEGVVERVVRRGVEPQSRTAIVFTGLEADDSREDRYAMSSMASSLEIRLRESLREELGATYSVSVNGSVSRPPESGYSVSISFGSDPDRVAELTAAVFAVIDSVVTLGPNEGDLEKVQELQRRSYETNLRENPWWAAQLVSVELYGGDPLNILRFRELIDSLTDDTIRETAGMYLRRDNYVVVTLVPEQPVQ